MQSSKLIIDEAVRYSLIKAEVANTTGQEYLSDVLRKKAKELRDSSEELVINEIKIKTLWRSI